MPLRSCRRRSAAVAVLSLLAFGAGCASVPTAAPEEDRRARTMPVPEGKALVYVYRPGWIAPTSKFETFVNGQLLGQIAVHTYYVAVVDPGNVLVEFPFASGASRLLVEARAGGRYVVQQALDRLPLGLVVRDSARLSLEDVDVERELACCRLIRVAAVATPWEETARALAAPVPPDRARVFVVRDLWAGAMEDFAASVTGQGALALPSRAFAVFDVWPGAVDVTVRAENTATLRVEAVAGRAHYVRAVPTMGWSRPSVKLVELTDAVGPRSLAFLRLARAAPPGAASAPGPAPAPAADAPPASPASTPR